MTKKRTAAIIISCAILISVAGIFLHLNFYEKKAGYTAGEGILRLTDWDEKTEELIFLDGVWEFYPEQLIDPGFEDKVFEQYKKIYVRVPGDWGVYSPDEYKPIKAGTYRLVIEVPKDGMYGIKTGTIRTSCRIYMNGKEVADIGIPSLHRNQYRPGSRYEIGLINSINNRIEVVIQVSSHGYRTGGILKSIKFGSAGTIIKENNKNWAIDAALVSVCLASAFYFFLQWFLRKHERFLLYFSGAGLFMGIYLSAMNEQVLNSLYNYDFFLRMRIQIAAMIMVTFCFLKFVRHFFERYRNSRFIACFTPLVLSMLVFLFNGTNNIVFIPVGAVQAVLSVVLMIAYVYILGILIKSIHKEEDSLEYILVLATSLFSYWVVIILKMLFEMETGYIPAALILFLLVGTAMMMSHRLESDHRRAKMLAEELVVYDRMRDNFLQVTSHEMRTPLHVIINLAKFMLEGKKGALNAAQTEGLFYMRHESQRLGRLVDDMLDASTIEKGEIDLKKGPVDACLLAESLIKEMRLLIPRDKDLTVLNQIKKDFPSISADQDRFKQIIYNLLHNAVKFTDSGSIVLTASIEGHMAKFRVSDTGSGIGPKDLERIFDSHYRGSGQERNDPGLGIGLSVVKHLVNIQGGTIDVVSSVGKGSTFSFTLPLYKAEDTTNSETVSIENPVKNELGIEGGPYTVLIVDDEISNQKVLLDLVSNMGQRAILADTGKEALDLIDKNRIDLAVLDIMLPDMSGDTVCEKIRNNYSMAELPILILTASGRVSNLMKSFKYGANDFLKKPADGNELISRMRSQLLIKASFEEGLNREFQYFYNQISPHFLYNTLNTIVGLCCSDQEKAKKALLNLATYLRKKMDYYRQNSLVDLDSELELVTAYLEIERMRYGDRLSINWDVEDNIKAMIPSLTLQPIVENSIRHGLIGRDHICISLSARRRIKEGLVAIDIGDDGPGMEIEKQKELLNCHSERLGLKNVIKRINILHNSKFELKSTPGKGTLIQITVPEAAFYENNFD